MRVCFTCQCDFNHHIVAVFFFSMSLCFYFMRLSEVKFLRKKKQHLNICLRLHDFFTTFFLWVAMRVLWTSRTVRRLLEMGNELMSKRLLVLLFVVRLSLLPYLTGRWTEGRFLLTIHHSLSEEFSFQSFNETISLKIIYLSLKNITLVSSPWSPVRPSLYFYSIEWVNLQSNAFQSFWSWRS